MYQASAAAKARLANAAPPTTNAIDAPGGGLTDGPAGSGRGRRSAAGSTPASGADAALGPLPWPLTMNISTRAPSGARTERAGRSAALRAACFCASVYAAFGTARPNKSRPASSMAKMSSGDRPASANSRFFKASVPPKRSVDSAATSMARERGPSSMLRSCSASCARWYICSASARPSAAASIVSHSAMRIFQKSRFMLDGICAVTLMLGAASWRRRAARAFT
jgi:hypothetical protein